MTEKLTDVSLAWGTPGDIEMTSDGGDDYSSTFRLTPRGAAKIAKALGASSFLWAEQCGHEYPDDGDAVHVAGEPSDMICLASPIFDAEPQGEPSANLRHISGALAQIEDAAARIRLRTEGLPSGRTQDEPSDAAVIAFLNHHYKYDPPLTDLAYWSPESTAHVRASLRAAGRAR